MVFRKVISFIYEFFFQGARVPLRHATQNPYQPQTLKNKKKAKEHILGHGKWGEVKMGKCCVDFIWNVAFQNYKNYYKRYIDLKMMVDDMWWKSYFDGRLPWLKGNLWWTTILVVNQYLIEGNFKWMREDINGRWALIKDDLSWNMPFY